jgi:hypothetical protein
MDGNNEEIDFPEKALIKPRPQPDPSSQAYQWKEQICH